MAEEKTMRKIIIEVSEDSVKLSKESQHASVFELIAVLNTLLNSYNTNKTN